MGGQAQVDKQNFEGKFQKQLENKHSYYMVEMRSNNFFVNIVEFLSKEGSHQIQLIGNWGSLKINQESSFNGK